MRRLSLLVGLVGTLLSMIPSRPLPAERVHDWLRVEGAGWQIASVATEDPLVTDEREGTTRGCFAGMVAVEGAMKHAPDDAIENMQNTTCLEWEPKSFPGRCLRFDAEHWNEIASALGTVPMHFCIDRFEYPDRRGAFPVVATSWREAGRLCATEGKRLCTEDEWTFACEGEHALPYPYGFERDDEVCVIDRRNPAFDAAALGRRDDAQFASELDRLWRGEASGTRPRCRSPFGVYDLTGNVDEWTISTRTDGRRSIMKGGYWGRIRARCRPSTRAHGEDFVFYQQGFRCCA